MKLLLDVQDKRLRKSLYDDHDAVLPDFIISEEVPLEVALLSRTIRPWDSRVFTPIDPTDWTIRASLGSFREPVGGTFEVSYQGTAGDLLVPAAGTTASDLDSAMNAIAAIVTAGGLVVTGSDGFFVISFNLPGARSIFMADATQAIPSLLLEFAILVAGDVDDRAIQTLRIEQAIASLADLDTDSDPIPATFTSVFGTDLLTSIAHGLTAGTRVKLFSTIALPAPLLDTRDYFVISDTLAADTFKVSATLGGASVNLSDNGTGTHSWIRSSVAELVTGDVTHNQKVRISLPPNLWGGSWTLFVAGAQSDLIGWDDGAQLLQSFMEGIAGVGAGNVTVVQDTDDSYIVSFKGSLIHTAILVAADVRDLKLLRTKNGSLDLRNAQVEFLLDGPESRVVTLELEISDPSNDVTKIQADVLLRRPVIKLDSVLAPFPAANYYTRDQIDALLAGIVGGSGSAHRLQEFTATAGQTVYTLTDTPVGSPIVFIRGLIRSTDSFTVLANVVTMLSGADIVAGDEVLIFYFY